MSERNQMLYLLHAERRLLDQVYRRRYQNQGLSWEAALACVQEEPERIERLVRQKMLYQEGNTLRLSPLIQQFWEQWDGTRNPSTSLLVLEEEWNALLKGLWESNSTPDDTQIRHWLNHLLRWQKMMSSWEEEGKSDRQLARKMDILFQQIEEELEKYITRPLGLDKELDRQLIRWREQIQSRINWADFWRYRPKIVEQVFRLQYLRRSDLLFSETNMEDQLKSEMAIFWTKPLSWNTWPTLEA